VFERLEQARAAGRTVREAIGRFARLPEGAFPDHEWAHVKTIDRYADKYASGQYGWYRLAWDEPAPSFGHVAKTYTLHPGIDDHTPPRVLSVREVLAILGFDDSFIFPDSVPRTTKYRMAADAVSPQFSRALARAIKEALAWV
jgi:DNA (cytosine-5)-methyltransferase 1